MTDDADGDVDLAAFSVPTYPPTPHAVTEEHFSHVRLLYLLILHSPLFSAAWVSLLGVHV